MASFAEQLREADRKKLANVIRNLERRRWEVEQLEVDQSGSLDFSAVNALQVAILDSLGAAFGEGTSWHWRYKPAADLYSPMMDTAEARRDLASKFAPTKANSLALLKRAIQSQQEKYQDEYPGEPVPSIHTARAGNAFAGLARVGNQIGASGDGRAGDLSVETKSEKFDAYAIESSVQAYNQLMVRVAVLEAAISSPTTAPIGLGHNGPPEFDLPFDEDNIREFIQLLKSQAPTVATDIPKVFAAVEHAEAAGPKFRQLVDDFATSAIKSAGTELGKRLAQLPFWMAVYSALASVAEAAKVWISTFP